jgi:anti-sigma factor RsiW
VKDTSPSPHPTAHALARYVDRTLLADEQVQVEDHLAGCSACREELAAVSALVPRRRRTRWLAAAVPLAAAALAIALLHSPRDDAAPIPALRDGGEGVERVMVVGPTVGARVVADSLRFAWRSAGPDARYHLTVTTTAGANAWAASTGDTVLVPARRGTRLGPGTYFWYVDALRPDGTTATTGVQRFEVVR